MLRFTCVCFVIVLLVLGCKNSSRQPLSSSGGSEVVARQILFANILLKKETDSTVTASLVNYKWRAGQLREGMEGEVDTPEVLYVQLLDATQKPLMEISEPNPLYRSVELFQPEGAISRQEVEVEEAYLSIRVLAPITVKYLNVISKTGKYSYLFELL